MRPGILGRRKPHVPPPSEGQDPRNPHSSVAGEQGGTCAQDAKREEDRPKNEGMTPNFSGQEPRNPQHFVPNPQLLQQNTPHDPQKIGVASEKVGPNEGVMAKKLAISGVETEKVGGHGEKTGPKSEVFLPPEGQKQPHDHGAETCAPPGTDMLDQAMRCWEVFLRAEAKLYRGDAFSEGMWAVYQSRVLAPLVKITSALPADQEWSIWNQLEPHRGGPGFANAKKAWFSLAGLGGTSHVADLLSGIVDLYQPGTAAHLWHLVQRMAYAPDERAARAAAIALNRHAQWARANEQPMPNALDLIRARQIKHFVAPAGMFSW